MKTVVFWDTTPCRLAYRKQCSERSHCLYLERRAIKKTVTYYTWSDNKVRELNAVKVLHTPFLNTTVVAFKVLPLGSYAPIPALGPPFKTILELDLWNVFQSCRCITRDAINVIKMPSFQYLLYLPEQKNVIALTSLWFRFESFQV